MSKDESLYSVVQRRLIGALLAEEGESSLNQVIDMVDEDDFQEPVLGLLFSCLAELARTNSPVSDVSLAKELDARGELKNVGGPATLYKLKDEGSEYLLDAPALLYAQIVKDSAAKYQIRKALSEYSEKFTEDSGVNASDAVGQLQTELNERLVKLADASTVTHFNEAHDDYMNLLDERLRISIENENVSDGLQGIPSLLPTLNHYTTGWLPGQMITVAARTGVGKSIFAIDCVLAAAKAGKTVMFFSLEMGRDEILDRLLSAATGIPQQRLKQGRLSKEERALVEAELETPSRIIIDTEANLSVDSMRARAIQQAQSDDGLDMIVADYLQLFTGTAKTNNRQEEVAHISRGVKLLAKQLGIPIMVLAQLNRADKNEEEDALPRLDNIRESAAIGHDSDIVIILHRAISKDGSIPPTLVMLEKNRNGEGQKKIFCTSNLECSLFHERVKGQDLEEDENEDDSAGGSSENDDPMGDFDESRFDTGDFDDTESFFNDFADIGSDD